MAGRAFAAANLEPFDVAFIDGLHTYEGAKVDTDLFAPLVKQGGLIIWNDYTQYFPGVVKVCSRSSFQTPTLLRKPVHLGSFRCRPVSCGVELVLGLCC